MKRSNNYSGKIVLTTLALFIAQASIAMDTDGDGVQDLTDNCRLVANPAQIDVDADLLGNACDSDFNNDGVTNFLDLVPLSQAFLTSNPALDINSDGVINFLDVAALASFFLQPPGPGATGASYVTDVQPVLESKCMPCHTGLGLGGHDIGINYDHSFLPTVNVSCGNLNVGECTLVRIRSGEMPRGAGCTGNPIIDASNVSCLNYDEQNLVFSWINGGLSP